MDKALIKKRVITLRQEGKTYGEMQKMLNMEVPKSTLSYWCKDIPLPSGYQEKIKKLNLKNARRGRAIAFIVNRNKREEYLQSIVNDNQKLKKVFKDKDVAKLCLSMLYLGEGGKTGRGSLMFGNSDPFIISLYLFLLDYCYGIEEHKIRCTVQCRADQNIEQLEKFWSKITKISNDKFYKTRIDPRTKGKPTKKIDYKGVCKIDYFSAHIFNELMIIPKVIHKGP